MSRFPGRCGKVNPSNTKMGVHMGPQVTSLHFVKTISSRKQALFAKLHYVVRYGVRMIGK